MLFFPELRVVCDVSGFMQDASRTVLLVCEVLLPIRVPWVGFLRIRVVRLLIIFVIVALSYAAYFSLASPLYASRGANTWRRSSLSLSPNGYRKRHWRSVDPPGVPYHDW